MWEIVSIQVQSGDAYESPHRRKAVCLQRLRETIQPERKPEKSHDNTL
jgi:hypothetical protein